jgi:nascent polypeptide-associated complex subunit alpha
MIPGIDPKKMQAIMKQMGMSQTEIPAKRVIIEYEETNIIIDNPSVMKVKMQGQTNFQISGDVREEIAGSSSEDDENSTFAEDIKTIIEKTGCSEEQAKQAIEDSNGDLAEAILSLS